MRTVKYQTTDDKMEAQRAWSRNYYHRNAEEIKRKRAEKKAEERALNPPKPKEPKPRPLNNKQKLALLENKLKELEQKFPV